MSKVVVLVRDLGPNRTQALSVIRRLTGLPLSEIIQRVQRRIPLVERVLFYRDHPDVARELTSLSRELPALGADLDLFEIPEAEEYSSAGEVAYFRLDAQVLANILAAHDKELRRQRKLAFREAESNE